MLNKNGIPLYIQLKDKLLEDIKANYKSGDIIPTELQLEKFYKVSRITVRKAIEQLQLENILEKKQGRGTFVKTQKILYEANSIGSLTQRLAKQNHQLQTKTLEYEIIKDKHYVKDLLRCDTLLCIKRFRSLNGIPFALMLNYLDIKTVPNLSKKFNIESLYKFLKDEYKIEFYNAKETVEAKNATKKEANKLKIKKGDALLSLCRLSFNKHNQPVEYSDILIKANMYQHNITLSNDKMSNL
jgi:DNA-binding GntR family transcriptional regulator